MYQTTWGIIIIAQMYNTRNSAEEKMPEWIEVKMQYKDVVESL